MAGSQIHEICGPVGDNKACSGWIRLMISVAVVSATSSSKVSKSVMSVMRTFRNE